LYIKKKKRLGKATRAHVGQQGGGIKHKGVVFVALMITMYFAQESKHIPIDSTSRE
jgi:hypothetical protein